MIRMTIACVVGWLPIAVSVASAQAAPARRNVLLLVSDDHGLELGCYGNSVIKTPNLDRLAARGTRFTNAFATVASCSASRSVLYTGQVNHTNGQYGHQHLPHNFYTRTTVKSLPAVLNANGYRSGLVAKLHVQPASVYPFEHLRVGGRNIPAIVKAATDFINADSDKPFFLVVGFSDPHRSRRGFGDDTMPKGMPTFAYAPGQVVVPPYLPDTPTVRNELVSYYRAVSRMDHGVGRILDALDRSGAPDSTLVIYLSDNGPAFPGAKTNLYDPGIHLPLIVRDPKAEKVGIANAAMVSWVDIAPTIYQWVGVRAPPGVRGRSVLPILQQENPAGWDTVFASHTFHEITMYYPMRVIRTRKYKYILNLAHKLDYPFASDLYRSPTWQEVLKTGAKTYGRRAVDDSIHRPREELYDLTTDPDEVRNLVNEARHKAALDGLRARLKAWQRQTQDPWVVKYEYE